MLNHWMAVFLKVTVSWYPVESSSYLSRYLYIVNKCYEEEKGQGKTGQFYIVVGKKK